MGKESVIKEMGETLASLTNLVSSIDEKQMNKVPFAKSWSAVKVIQHVIISHSGFEEVLNGSVIETNRAPHEKVGMIRRDFLDFTIKMKSPDL